MGTKDNYHYFAFFDINLSIYYKIRTYELKLNTIIPYTENRNNWIVMPWGPHRLNNDSMDVCNQ